MNLDSDIVNASSAPFNQNASGDLMGRMQAGSSLASNTGPNLDLKANSSNSKPNVGVGTGGDLSSKLAPDTFKKSNLSDSFADPKKSFLESITKKGEADTKKKTTENKKDEVKASGDDKAADPAETEEGEEKKPAEGKKKKRARWKKPKDKPNRPLSAYNLFFQAQRVEMLGDSAPNANAVVRAGKRIHRKTHGKIGFAEMARVIGQKWKSLPADEKQPFEEQAAKEKKRYATELENWKEEQKRKAAASKKSAKQAARLKAEMEANAAAGGDSSATDAQLRMRMMMAQAGGDLGASGRGQGDVDYLRALQERQQRAAFLSRSGMMGDMFSSQYPNAAEASASALLQQFQGGGSGGDLSTPQEVQVQLLELQKQQLELQQKQLRLQAAMNQHGGPGSPAGVMPQGIGFGIGPSAAAAQQQLQQHPGQFGQSPDANTAAQYAAMMRSRQGFGM